MAKKKTNHDIREKKPAKKEPLWRSAKNRKLYGIKPLFFILAFAAVGSIFLFRSFASIPPDATPGITLTTNSPTSTFNLGDKIILTWSTSPTASQGCGDNVIGQNLADHGSSQPITATGGFQWFMHCNNQNGQGTNSIYITVNSGGGCTSNCGTPPSAPNLNSATPNAVGYAPGISLSWNVPSSSGSSGVTGYKVYRSTSSSGTYTNIKSLGSQLGYTDNNVSAGTTYYYKVTASNSAGESGKSSVKSASPVATPAAQITSFYPDPASITKGQSSTLKWASNYTTACSASWTGQKGTSGSQTVSPQGTTPYSITCSNYAGSISANTTISVNSLPVKPTVSLVAKPASIAYNSYTYLQWNSSDATTCNTTWTSSRATSGTQQIGRLTKTATYTINCSGAGGNTTASAKVTVGAAPTGCPPNCPTPAPPPAPAAEIAPPVVEDTPTEVVETPVAKPPVVAKKGQNHLKDLLLGGLLGELIGLVKHSASK